ncbi:hypothetical protein [Brevundimonas lutea]|uniref:hypothetical protein n=1 Tax=Brevundimonas lutea TaxID=2293980 RepID=UPI000F01DEEE|nr:hypothetical protein [Brevundimonas lutea]
MRPTATDIARLSRPRLLRGGGRLALIAGLAGLMASPALAQQRMGSRMLNWAGKPVVAAQSQAAVQPDMAVVAEAAPVVTTVERAPVIGGSRYSGRPSAALQAPPRQVTADAAPGLQPQPRLADATPAPYQAPPRTLAAPSYPSMREAPRLRPAPYPSIQPVDRYAEAAPNRRAPVYRPDPTPPAAQPRYAPPPVQAEPAPQPTPAPQPEPRQVEAAPVQPASRQPEWEPPRADLTDFEAEADARAEAPDPRAPRADAPVFRVSPAQNSAAPSTEPASDREALSPSPVPNAAPVADPNAPRRDALIFQLNRPQAAPRPDVAAETQGADATASEAPEPQPSTQASAQTPPPPARRRAEDDDSARYYSVHRQAGRQPDPTPIPDPVYLDFAPVDLAEPPPAPVIARQNGLAPSVAENPLP